MDYLFSIKTLEKKTVTIPVILYLIFISFSQQGCSSAELVAKQASSADDTYHKTVVLYFWGVMDYSESIDCKGQGFKRVSTRTNWLYALCTVVSLGAVVPLELEYRCTSQPLIEGNPIGQIEDIPFWQIEEEIK
jgi:hypothetical protein